MRLHRFYIKEKVEVGKEIMIEDPELLNQWGKVFRLGSGDKIIIFNGDGFDYECSLNMLSKNKAILEVIKSEEIKNIQKIELHLFQSIIKKDNFEFVVEKCTEIGTNAFHPILSDRSEKKNLNIERLKKIAEEASEQSGRGIIPKIFEPETLENSIKDFDGEIFALDFEKDSIKNIIFSRKVGVLIGPEGGWSDKERDFFREKGIKTISLGLPVLRAETASIVASTLILLK